MQTRISLAEGAALHGLLEEATGDIIVRVDALGFIETASSTIALLGYDRSGADRFVAGKRHGQLA